MTTTYDTDRDATIRRIKTALKKRSGKTWSVTGGKGTAYGWISIDAPPARRTWQDVTTHTPEPPVEGAIYRGALGFTPEYRVCAGAEEPITSPADDPWAREAAEQGRQPLYCWEVSRPGEPFGHMSPDERVELGRLLGLSRAVHFQGQSIAADPRYRVEYIDRAEGRKPSRHGERYWD